MGDDLAGGLGLIAIVTIIVGCIGMIGSSISDPNTQSLPIVISCGSVLLGFLGMIAIAATTKPENHMDEEPKMFILWNVVGVFFFGGMILGLLRPTPWRQPDPFMAAITAGIVLYNIIRLVIRLLSTED